jgi:hypothetical protein
MFVSLPGCSKNHNIKAANKLSGYVANLEYLGMTKRNKNYIYEKFISRNICYLSVENLLHLCLLPKDTKIKIQKTLIILTLNVCET